MAKYAELVVDEAQDCSAADLHILRQLHELDLPLILICDPDQAIYGFRGAANDALMALATTLGHRKLVHNWRSTTIICTLTATLRGDPARRTPDIAVANHHDAEYPVLLYTSKDRDAVTADFLAYAARIGIAPTDCMVLSHSQAALPKTYAGTASMPDTESGRLAWAAGILNEYPNSDRRRGVFRRLLPGRPVSGWCRGRTGCAGRLSTGTTRERGRDRRGCTGRTSGRGDSESDGE